MRDFIIKLKIPTVLGLAIIMVGIVAGVFLTLKEQTFKSQASVNVDPENLTVTNITDTEASISWQTSTPTASFITYGLINPDEETVLDDRDNKTPTEHQIHHVTLKNLIPKTTYQYKIVTGKSSSKVSTFTTTTPINTPTSFKPIIGSVLKDNKPVDEALVFLSMNDALDQSTVVKTSGNFLLPINQVRKSDLSDIFLITDDTYAKLSVASPQGQASILFQFKNLSGQNLPPIQIGQDLDLTNSTTTPSDVDLSIYDLNGDGKVNSADNSIILGNLGKNPKNKKADLNQDGIVDQHDLDLLTKILVR